MSSDGVVQVVEESGDFSDAPDWFAENADLGAEVLAILAVLSPKASGKFTLYNAALVTAFAVAARGVSDAPPPVSPPQRPADTPPYSNSTLRAATPAPAAARDARSRHPAPPSPPRVPTVSRSTFGTTTSAGSTPPGTSCWGPCLQRQSFPLRGESGGGPDGGSSGAVDGDRRGGGGGDDGETAFRSALVLAARDADDHVEHDLLHQLVVNDARELW
jgi:hypothetical protein